MAENTTKKHARPRFPEFPSLTGYPSLSRLIIFHIFRHCCSNETKTAAPTAHRIKRALTLLLFIINIKCLQAQQLSGIVTDAQTKKTLADVAVSNISKGIGTYTHADGSYLIAAVPGDSILFSRVGFKSAAIKLSKQAVNIVLIPLAFELEEVTVNRQMTPYQKDSVERRAIFRKKVDQRPVKVVVAIVPLGIGINGAVTALAEKISRKYRQLKKFQKRYKETEKELFAASRYTKELVGTLIPLKEQELIIFMQRYPIEPDFACAATDVELSMWILYNYRQWQQARTALSTGK